MSHLLLLVIYLSFISLGLPDGLLGAAWPTMYGQLGVPVSYAGIISMIIALGTILSSLQSHRLTRRMGTGRVTALSVAMTAVALLGFSVTHSFWGLCLWAIPYGLGAGSVDASLNNYVALHYESRHMSWLHCMWGVGATLGPYLMGIVLTAGKPWNVGYGSIGVVQVVLAIGLVLSLPLWKRRANPGQGPEKGEKALSLAQVVAIPGAKELMVSFLCYCGVEQTAGLWAGSYLTLCRGVAPETAAAFAGMFFLGITLGRGVSGFVTMKLGDTQMIRLGLAILGVGVLVLLLPGPWWLAMSGLILVGLGCAPIYPSIIHATPARFGQERSQALIGVEMASAYVGTCALPPLFGFVANHITAALLPVFLLVLLVVMAATHEAVVKKTA